MIFSCKDDSLDYQVYFYEDIDNTKSFETIKSVSWILSKDNKPSFGIKDSTVWLKVILPVNHSYQYIQIEYPLLDSIDIHYTDLEGNSINLYGGDRYPYNTRSYLAPSYIFLLDRVTTNPVFIKIRSTSSLLAAISMHTSQSIQKSQNKNTLILGIYFGFLILIALYNILLSISLRDMTFGFYSVYVSLTCLTFFSLEGFSFQHLWPNSIQWNNISFVFISALAFIAALEFTKRYLRLTFRNTKIRFWILTIYQGCLFILGCSVAFVSYRMFSGLYNIIAALVAFSIFFISMYSVINGDRPARYFLFAWTIFLFGMIILPLRFAAILPDNSITHGIPFIGSALEVLLLSLGLGDRFNQQKKDSLNQQIVLTNSFARFVPKQFLTFLNKHSITDIELGDSVQKEMTVLFSDIRNFTALSESMTPKENFDFINALLKRIGPVVRFNNGFIDKYIGDAIMALFPESPDDAIKASIEIRKLLSLYNQRRFDKDLQPISIGIGIHTGLLMLGTIGEEERMEGTVISDTVNLASRLEGLSKHYGVTTIVSEKSILKLKDPSLFNFRVIDKVKVKGKDESVSIIEIFDGDSPVLHSLKLSTRAKFERAMACYLNLDFTLALQYFRSVLDDNSEDSVALMYIKRIEKYEAGGLPLDWDGVIRMDSK